MTQKHNNSLEISSISFKVCWNVFGAWTRQNK